MNKALKTILIISIAFFSVGILLIPSTWAQAQNLVVEFEQTPLFNEANFLPGESVPRWVKVTNNSGETKSIATEAINYPGFPEFNNVPGNDLSRALNIIIREKGGNDLYGGSTGVKTLFNFYEDGETYLSDISNSNFKEYEFEITFPSEKENDWQEKTTYFDILIGFEGTEGGGDNGGGGDGGGGGGGGGSLPLGLTIFNEADKNIATTSITITWQTNYFSTSQVIYGTEAEAHTLNLSDNTGTPPKYGYAHTTPEYDISPKVTAHSVTITGLSPGTTYYYRCVSHASLAVSTSHSFTTLGVKEEEIPSDFEEGEIIETIEEALEKITEGTEETTGAEELITELQELLVEEEIITSEQEELLAGNLGLLANMGIAWGEISQSLLLAILVIILLILLLLILIDKIRKWAKERRKKYTL